MRYALKIAIITDIPWINQKSGEKFRGYYMDKWLAQNLERIPKHLKKGWDVVCIVSGSGLVRVGKSTLAMQMAAYVDWCLSGGKMIWNEAGQVTGLIPPNKPLRFGLDNVVFSPEDLIKVTKEKGAKSKYNTFVLDEGREGLLGARVMESVNKKFEDYFQTCGVYNNFVIIVLPDYFKLAEQYCVNRSMFLINCFHKNYERGYFSFFNTLQKERLYFFGKKRLGISARYGAASRNFWGRFSKWLPFDETKYNNKKKAAIGKAKWSKYDVAQMKQRDLMAYLAYKNTDFTIKEIAATMAELGAPEYTANVLERSLRNAKRILENKKIIVDEDEEPAEELLTAQDIKERNLEEGEIETVKRQNPGMESYNKEYDNTSLLNKTFSEEKTEDTEEESQIIAKPKREIIASDDPYDTEPLKSEKDQLYRSKHPRDRRTLDVNPDKDLFPGDKPVKTENVEPSYVEKFNKLDQEARKVLNDAKKGSIEQKHNDIADKARKVLSEAGKEPESVSESEDDDADAQDFADAFLKAQKLN